MSENPSVIYITTNRFGDLLLLDAEAAAFLNVARRRAGAANLLHFFIEGRVQMAADLRAVASVELPPREVVLRPKERAARRVLVSVCETDDGVRWTLRDQGLAKPARPPAGG